MSDENRKAPDEDELPRQSLWAMVPKRSLSRVLLLLALLAVILFLRHRTGSIANCMSEALHAPAPAPAGVRVKGPAVVPPAPRPESPAR